MRENKAESIVLAVILKESDYSIIFLLDLVLRCEVINNFTPAKEGRAEEVFLMK